MLDPTGAGSLQLTDQFVVNIVTNCQHIAFMLSHRLANNGEKVINNQDRVINKDRQKRSFCNQIKINE